MKIYTRSGDQGQTRLCSPTRLAKDNPRLETLGTIDELSAVLGLVRTEPPNDQTDRVLLRVQNELIDVCTELASCCYFPVEGYIFFSFFLIDFDCGFLVFLKFFGLFSFLGFEAVP